MAIDTTNQITVEFTPVDTFQSTDILTLSGTTAVLNRLDGLDDVIEDKYIVQELDLDGGTF